MVITKERELNREYLADDGADMLDVSFEDWKTLKIVGIEQQIEELKELLIEVESVDAHAKSNNFNEDLQLRISDKLNELKTK